VPVDPIYRMVWKKKSFEKGPKMKFPSETVIFGLTMADIRGKGKPEIIAFDRFDRLSIFSEDGKGQWRSRDRFGGTNNFYDTKKKADIAFRPGDAPPWRTFIPGRILIRDLYRDGTPPQIIVNKNEFSTRLSDKMRSYEKGEIQGLVWEEDDLMASWKTREIKGYIADYQVKDVENDGNEELVVAVAAPPGGGEDDITGILSRKERSNIYFFKLY
jgi:hypothetical protein